MATLADKQAELALAKAALNAARLAQSYNHGDNSTQRAALSDLEVHVSRVAREVDELTAAALGANNSLFVTASYR